MTFRRIIALIILSVAAVAVERLGWHAALPAKASAMSVRIVYPGEGDKLPYLVRSFVFGSSLRGSKVTVNGSQALVAPSGGWIAFIPFAPGAFRLHVVARKAGDSAMAERTVNVAMPMRTLPADPARVDASVAPAPEQNLSLEPGDTVNLFIKASTGARVWASAEGAIGNMPLAETSAPSLNPSDRERVLGDAVTGGANVRGLYEGQFRIPPSATGTLKITYTVTAPNGSSVTAAAKGSITVLAPGWYRVGYIIVGDRRKDIDARPYGIVESEPEGGWLFFPPPRTPFEVTGSAGEYYRVALGADEQAWVNKRSLELAPAGTPAPRTSLQGVVIRGGARASTVIIHLTGKVPFSVDESVEGPTLRVRVYGAVAGTDFVRYGDDRSNVEAVRWDQLAGGIALVEVRLRQRTLWGYRAQWHGNDLELTVKKTPAFKPAPNSALNGLLVVIDPGHSPDIGAIGPLGTQERDVNLSIAKRLAARLESLGARTALTRTANVPMGLYDRTNVASRLNADVLISVHNNALPDGINPFTHHGFSVYYYQPQSLELARAIHNAYKRDIELPDYGLYYDNLALARPTEEPAVLTESAFIMWPPEEMDLRSPAFQERIAVTLADGMSRWAGSMRALELAK